MSMDKYICVYKDGFPKELCEELINIFDTNTEWQTNGRVGSGYNPDVKKTKDMHSWHAPVLEQYNKIIWKCLNDKLLKYYESFKCDNINIFPADTHDTGYQIQKYKQNDGEYKWHTDQWVGKEGVRVLTFLFYLNDVDEGGETQILDYKIKPEAGKLLLFPPFFKYIHRGNIPISSDKYIVTGWLHAK